MASREEYCRNPAETRCGAHRANQKQSLAADSINDRHGEHGEYQVRSAYRHSLKIGRNLIEAGVREDVVEVIQDGVDARKLVKHPDRDRQENWEPVFPGEERIVGDMLRIDRHNDILEFLFVIFFASHAKYVTRLGYSLLFDQPPGATRDAEEKQKKQDGGYRRNTKFPPPFGGAKLHRSYDVVREIGEQNSKDNVELKQTHEAAPPLGGRNLSYIHRAKNGGTTDAEPPDEPEKHESKPVPCKGTTKRRNDIQDSHDAETVTAANFISGNPGKHGSEDRPPQRNRHCQAQCGRRESEGVRERMRGASDDGSVKSEE